MAGQQPEAGAQSGVEPQAEAGPEVAAGLKAEADGLAGLGSQTGVVAELKLGGQSEVGGVAEAGGSLERQAGSAPRGPADAPQALPAGSPPPRPADSPPLRPADALVIAGLVPMSTVDWPGNLVATIFTQGCPWNCFYCHNHALIPTRLPGTVPWAAVRELLGRRHGLLDGVVFTGGEALRQDCLADAAREVVEAGFRVGLHSAGCYPRRLADLAASGLLSWVGLDIKALPEHYPAVVGRPNSGQKAWDSLEVLLASQGVGGPDFEVRTTVVPDDVTAADAVEVARRCRELGVGAFALQQARSQGARAGFTTVAPGWDAQCERMAAQIEALGFERFEFRPA